MVPILLLLVLLFLYHGLVHLSLSIGQFHAVWVAAIVFYLYSCLLFYILRIQWPVEFSCKVWFTKFIQFLQRDQHTTLKHVIKIQQKILARSFIQLFSL